MWTFDEGDTMNVTAVITTYKRPAQMLERALKSAINQTYQDMDIIVVNDYPEDLCLVDEIGRMIDSHRDERKIQYIVVSKNGGACRARNMAVAAIDSKYIAFLDDDDEWLPEKIEKQISVAERHPEAAIVYCNAYMQVDGQSNRSLRFDEEQPSGDIFYDVIAKNIIGSCTFPLIRADALRAVEGFREDMPALQDWELYLRILKHGSAVYIHEPLAVYYFYDGERISTNSTKRIDAYEKIHEEFDGDIGTNKKSASAFYLMGTYFYSLNLEKRKAFSYYVRGVKNDPANVKRNVKDFFRMAGRGIVKTKRI